MKTLLIFGCSASLLYSCRERTDFVVNVIDTPVIKSASDLTSVKRNLYEDADFSATASCAGEFGGGLQLTDKKTGRIYGCFATCPLAFYKLHGKYMIVSTLAHGSGFSSISELEDPRKLRQFTIAIRHGRRYLEPATNDTAFKHGVLQLADTMNLLTVSSFMRRGKLYHVMSDFKRTYLASNNRQRFIILRPLANFSTFDSNDRGVPAIIRLADGHCITFYHNSSARGYVEVHEDTINLVRYQNLRNVVR